MRPFLPKPDATSTIAATVASGRVAFAKPPSGSFQVRVVNSGTTLAFVAFGDVTVAADAATDIPVLGGASATFTVNNCDAAPITHAAAIMASGTASIYFTTGDGA